MTRATRALLILSIGLLMLGRGSGAWACSCAQASNEEFFERAQIVFVGEAVRAEDHNAGGTTWSTADPIIWSFDVSAIQKGNVDDPQQVTTARVSDSCGFGFVVGKRYQVFAHERDDGDQWTSLCSGTRDLADASAYEPRLHASKPPSPSETPSVKPAPQDTRSAAKTSTPPLAGRALVDVAGAPAASKGSDEGSSHPAQAVVAGLLVVAAGVLTARGSASKKKKNAGAKR